MRMGWPAFWISQKPRNKGWAPIVVQAVYARERNQV